MAHTMVDLFAGIGGFHLAFHDLGAECVFASEWDSEARKTYTRNFASISPELFESGNFAGDITQVDKASIPDFDILTGGFPCQPFSVAGQRKGFDDLRGTAFFDIAEIIRVKQPKAYFLENVQNLRSHDEGRTLNKIRAVLTEDLGYSFQEFTVMASDHGLPQRRPRVFMIGFRDSALQVERPKPRELAFSMSDVMGGEVDREIGFTLRVGGAGSGIHDRRNWNAYIVDGQVAKLSPSQGKRMQGFPDNFEFPVSNKSAMKQLGNSVAVWAVRDFAREIIRTLDGADRQVMASREDEGADVLG